MTTDKLAKQLEEKEQECKELEQELEFWKKEGDRTHLLMLEKRDELVKEILKNDQLEKENEILEKDKANLDAIIETLKAQFKQLEKEKDLLQQECENWERQVLFADKQIDEMQDEINLLQQHKKSNETLLAEQIEIKKYLGISHKTILERLEELTDFRDEDREIIDQLEKENIKLKELVKTRIEDLCDSCGASSMMPMSCKVYEQALQEIKGIVFELMKADKSYKFDKYSSKILQKCEALKDE